MKIPFFITIDTEGDNLWDRPDQINTTNAFGIERFQNFCDNFGFKPIYLVNYEMLNSSIFVKSVSDALKENKCEIGAHIHAWNSPPIITLTDNDTKNLPYLIDYSDEIMEQKIAYLTSQLENIFEQQIISHRAGRWAVNDKYLKLLHKYGYKVDCSVTPFIDWRFSMGNPHGAGGADYREFPENPYYPLEGINDFIEIPMSTSKNMQYNNLIVNSILKYSPRGLKQTMLFNALNARRVKMLRPCLGKGKNILNLVEKLSRNPQIEHLEFMIHSSELYHGTNPKCKTVEQIDSLYEDMEILFRRINEFCTSITFKEYIYMQNKGDENVKSK